MSSVETIQTGDVPLRHWVPDHPNGAGLVVVHEIFGISDYIVDRCRDLAGDGYLVVAPDLYGRLAEPPVFDPESPDYVMQGVNASQRLDWDLAVADTLAALEWVRQAVPRAGVLGFCFGGGIAFNAAAVGHPDALVSYYGSAMPRLAHLSTQVTCPQLHQFGLDDAFISTEAQGEIYEQLGASRGPLRWETYAGAGHAFDNPHALFEHAEARGEAWKTTLDFLRQYLVET